MDSANKPPFWEQNLDEPHELAPDDVEALIRGSREAQNPEVALEYAQRAADIHPDHPLVQETVQRTVFTRLSHDAFLAFVAENSLHYVIRFRNSRPIVVPKARTHQEAFPTLKRTQGERVLGMIWWVMLGLVPAGLGAVLLAPMVAYRALYVLTGSAVPAREKRMAWLTILLAGVLELAGAFFTFLLILHLIG
jgi:hypothetical protein